MQATTDFINALKNQENFAKGCSSDFAKGYQMALAHAIELAEVMALRQAFQEGITSIQEAYEPREDEESDALSDFGAAVAAGTISAQDAIDCVRQARRNQEGK